MRKTIIAVATVAALSGCKWSIETVNDGEVLSYTGAHDCVEASCEFEEAGAIDEWLVGFPGPGHFFAKWTGCPDVSNVPYCRVKFDEQTVQNAKGATVPPVVALFAPDDAIPVTATACAVGPGMDETEHCGSIVGQDMWVDWHLVNGGVSTLHIIGWDNLRYSGGYAGMYGADNGDGMFMFGSGDEWYLFRTSDSYDCGGLDGCGVSVSVVVQ